VKLEPEVMKEAKKPQPEIKKPEEKAKFENI
jgi:hypothetical protein